MKAYLGNALLHAWRIFFYLFSCFLGLSYTQHQGKEKRKKRTQLCYFDFFISQIREIIFAKMCNLSDLNVNLSGYTGAARYGNCLWLWIIHRRDSNYDSAMRHLCQLLYVYRNTKTIGQMGEDASYQKEMKSSVPVWFHLYNTLIKIDEYIKKWMLPHHCERPSGKCCAAFNRI